MMRMSKTYNPILKVILSAGGTGGHIFPAVAIATQLKQLYPNVDILFVGAKNKMEMEKIPQAGYPIIGLDIYGWDRKNIWKNFALPYKLLKSFIHAFIILKRFKPNIVMGFGGYASFAVVRTAQFLNIPNAIHEQNSIAGKSNLILAKKANFVFVAYLEMEKYFIKNKLVFSGNPLRENIKTLANISQQDALKYMNLQTTTKTILLIGGSLGSKTMNETIYNNLDFFTQNKCQLIWQCGNDFDKYEEVIKSNYTNIVIHKFIANMEYAYSAADLIISRAGALSVSELCFVGKPVIFIPFPFAAEDHQTFNAKRLCEKQAALMIADQDVATQLMPLIKKCLHNPQAMQTMQDKIALNGIINADIKIVENILRLAKKQTIQIERIQSIYFIGIGGAGMTALVRYCLYKKIKVYGYDKTKSSDTLFLEQQGVKILYADDITKLPLHVDCVVYTPAIPQNLAILNYYANKHFSMLKRSQFLGLITKNQFNVCVSGTHGKTTITSMVAHLLHSSAVSCNAFVGGKMLNYQSNFLHNQQSKINVIEADEYDKSFLQLSPNIIVLSAMDEDHLDIYKTKENMIETYFLFLNKMSSNGLLILPHALAKAYDFSKFKFITYSTDNENATIYSKNAKTNSSTFEYDVFVNNKKIERFILKNTGLYNIENSLASIAVAYILELETDNIKTNLASFKGVKRRFEIIFQSPRITYIDDYAHHPEEIKVALTSIKKMLGDKKIMIVFQPHLYSRTKDYANEFAEVFNGIQNLVLLPIYAAREKPISGITSEWLLKKIDVKNKIVLKPIEVIAYIKKHAKNLDVIVSIGAGDISLLVEDIKMLVDSPHFII